VFDWRHMGKQRLTFITASDYKCRWNKKHAIYLCECGNTKTLCISLVNNNKTISCGCVHTKNASLLNRTHGLSNIPEYRVWAGMIQRCYNPNNKEYHNYGGRGIDICEAWRNNFVNFARDMGPRPDKYHSIERLNNNLGYNPSNCVWANIEQQSKNKQQSRKITFNGKTKNISDWAKEIGISATYLSVRLEKHPIELALTAKKSNRSGLK